MTRKVGNVVIIEEEKPNLCETRGKEKETRPYGKNDSEVCYACMTATPESEAVAKNAFNRLLDNTVIL